MPVARTQEDLDTLVRENELYRDAIAEAIKAIRTPSWQGAQKIWADSLVIWLAEALSRGRSWTLSRRPTRDIGG